ncbi:aspartate aminotransferase [Diaporthe amygdali]|uniref:aspartate aminotransferase n=1 Tax=Phomopsis amygdali TaxID=1214568 RepID=UPI0022FE5CD0|nr:aspartate aminotransferase [Diaporthe amygdali]KAJ0124598.1 aspartate aminotransferase [Diaporthe amygdali]
MFGHIQPGPPDPMFILKKNADNDRNPEKVDLGVGIYRSEACTYQELEVVKLAKGHLERADLGHDISSVQTISGTGANALGALLIAKAMQPKPKVYIGIPTWGNHLDIFQNVNIEIVTYQYLDSSKHVVDFAALLNAVRTAPPDSVFILQGCCHNPSGVDLSVQQWEELASEMRANGHLPFFDTAYQGLGDGLSEDAVGVRTFVEAGMEMLVCQSFSKNFALYGERCGALHVVANSSEVAFNVQDRLRSLIRYTYSSPPAYGSRLVKTVLNDNALRKAWIMELDGMRKRLKRNRHALHDQLVNVLKTPGDWTYLLNEKGLFS